MKRFINYLMPEFFNKMPEKKRGAYTASVDIYNFRTRETVWKRKFNGRRRAYFAARLKALWWDLWQPSWRGIDWQITGEKPE